MSQRQPALRPTEPATLVVAALAAAAVGWLLVSNLYQDMPALGWPPVMIIVALAAVEAGAAWNLRVRIHQRGRARTRSDPRGRPEPVDPLRVASFAVLAKASSVAGALFAGFYAGMLPWLGLEAGRLAAASADLPPSVAGLLASGALLATALWLESSCRIPEHEEDEEQQNHSDPDR